MEVRPGEIRKRNVDNNSVRLKGLALLDEIHEGKERRFARGYNFIII